jgi:hypothetical protein
MEETINAAPEFDLNKVLAEAKEEVSAPESQPENEPVTPETEKKEDSEVPETNETEEYKKNAKTRIQELLRDRKEQEDRIKRLEEEQSKVKKEFMERKPTVPGDEHLSSIPPEFVKMYGYNEEGWKLYKQLLHKEVSGTEERIIEKAMERITSQQMAENERRNAIQRQIDEASEQFNVNSSELRKFATDHPIMKQDGNFDFQEIVDYMKYKKGDTAKAKARKKISSINNTNAESKPTKFFGPEDYL